MDTRISTQYKKGDLVGYIEPFKERNHSYTGIVTDIFNVNEQMFLEVLTLTHSLANPKSLNSSIESIENFTFNRTLVNASRVIGIFNEENENSAMLLRRFESLYPSLVEFVHFLRRNKYISQKIAMGVK